MEKWSVLNFTKPLLFFESLFLISSALLALNSLFESLKLPLPYVFLLFSACSSSGTTWYTSTSSVSSANSISEKLTVTSPSGWISLPSLSINVISKAKASPSSIPSFSLNSSRYSWVSSWEICTALRIVPTGSAPESVDTVMVTPFTSDVRFTASSTSFSSISA